MEERLLNYENISKNLDVKINSEEMKEIKSSSRDL